MLQKSRKRLRELMSRMDKFIMNITENPQLFKFSLSSLIAAAGGYVSSFLGGIDKLLITLITMIVIDYVTGVIRAIYKKQISSAVGFKGIMKKILMLLIVGLSVTLQNILPAGVPLREITILFFIANEGFSILENASELIPLPEKIRSVLAQIQQKSANSAKGKDAQTTDADKTSGQIDMEESKQIKQK